MMICGVDEAGRGPVLGPMVIAAVMVRDDATLKALQVRDSKKLSPARREELAIEIRKVARTEVAVEEAESIDAARKDLTLNQHEARLFGRLIELLHPEEVFIDACDVDERRFGRMVQNCLSYRPRMVCVHKADDIYPVVSAASIIAKTVRDARVRLIEEEFGEPVGTGYCHDPVTTAFLEKWIREKGDMPPHSRRSWATARRITSLAKNARLTDWE